MGRKLELAIGVLNGALGDHLAKTGNGLATELSFVRDGEPIAVARLAGPMPRVVVLLHGLMCTEDIWQFPDGNDYGALLARDFGFTPLYVRYNTGRPIADSGRALAKLLEELVTTHDIAEILPLGYSMGGLVLRSACHHASLDADLDASWLSKVHRAFYVATPHHGAPLERAGRVLTRLLARIPDPYVKLVADIAELRSAGIKDLGNADLRDEDRASRDGFLADPHHPVPLLSSIRHHLVAGSLSREPWLTELFGDTMVPISSGTNGHHAGPRALPPAHVKVLPGLSHMDLAHHPEVYAQLESWLRESES
mgnify:CR=1 FL=1